MAEASEELTAYGTPGVRSGIRLGVTGTNEASTRRQADERACNDGTRFSSNARRERDREWNDRGQLERQATKRRVRGGGSTERGSRKGKEQPHGPRLSGSWTREIQRQFENALRDPSRRARLSRCERRHPRHASRPRRFWPVAPPVNFGRCTMRHLVHPDFFHLRLVLQV